MADSILVHMRATLLLLTITASLLAEPQPERLAWNRTPEALAGRRVVVELTSGTRIEGQWTSVTADSFAMRISKTSNVQEIPKGLQIIPRAQISSVKVGKRRIRGRVIGIATGFYGIAGIAGAITGSGEALQGPAGIAAFAGAVTGYFIGRSYDHALRPVVLLPD